MRPLAVLASVAALTSAGCILDFDENFGDGPSSTSGTVATTGAAGGGAASTGGGGSGTNTGGDGGTGGAGGAGGGDPCPDGCWDGTTCQAGTSPQACGAPGSACTACDDANPCTEDICNAGTCENPALDCSPNACLCPGGSCQIGPMQSEPKTCVPSAEDCTNGVDDNGDSLIDCQDPICTGFGYACVPDPPAGWSGPVALYAGVTPAGCAGAYAASAAVGGTGLMAPPASCTACGCTSTCDGATVTLHANTSAAGMCSACDVPLTLAHGVCSSVPASDPCMAGASPYYALGTAQAPDGSCTPSGGALVQPPTTWSTNKTVCQTPAQPISGGCGAGKCAPPSMTPFGDKLCVFKSGNVPCDGADYTVGQVVYTTVTPPSGCTACTCTDPSCTGTISFWSAPGCPFNSLLNGFWTQVPGSECDVLGSPFPTADLSVRYDAGPDGLACSTNTATPMGSATQSGPVTVCCQP